MCSCYSVFGIKYKIIIETQQGVKNKVYASISPISCTVYFQRGLIFCLEGGEVKVPFTMLVCLYACLHGTPYHKTIVSVIKLVFFMCRFIHKAVNSVPHHTSTNNRGMYDELQRLWKEVAVD